MISFVLLAGGIGTRMKQSIPKQFLMLAGKPVILHVLERIEEIDEISEVIVVCLQQYKGFMQDYIKKYNLKKKYKLVDGGKTRQESVLNGLLHTEYETVIIHEAARPFVKKEDFIKLINSEYQNATYGVDIPFTVLQKEYNCISGLLDRSSLLNIQLPQKFEKTTLLAAHYKAINDNKEFTEDCSLLYYYFNKDIIIYILEGKDYNIKLTNSVDLLVAEQIYKEYMVM